MSTRDASSPHAGNPFHFDRAALTAAAEIVRRSIAPTPQIAWPLLAVRTGAEVWVKHENHLPTGAFKMRGGLVLVDSLMRGAVAGAAGARPTGTITASVGNHGMSQVFAGCRAGLHVVVVVPVNNNPEKNAALRSMGAELVEAGHDYSAAYDIAAELAVARGLFLVEPFLPDLVRGVATYALELFSAVSDLDAVYVPIGMGSGICGLIRTRDLLGLKTRIVGIVSTEAPAQALSFEAGHVVTTVTAATLADGIAVRVPKPEAVAMIRAGADRILRVSEDEIAQAVRAYHDDTHNMAEGAAAAALAGLIQERAQMQGKRVAVILSGANIARPLLARLLAA